MSTELAPHKPSKSLLEAVPLPTFTYPLIVDWKNNTSGVKNTLKGAKKAVTQEIRYTEISSDLLIFLYKGNKKKYQHSNYIFRYVGRAGTSRYKR